MENLQVRQRMLMTQNKWKEKFDKQVQVIEAEQKLLRRFQEDEEPIVKSQDSDSQKKGETDSADKAKKGDNQEGSGKNHTKGQPAMVNIDEICKLIDRKIKKLDRRIPKADLKLVIRLHSDQDFGSQGLLLPRLSLMCSRDMTFIHLSTLLAHKNGFNEDEWSNIEFYADVDFHKLSPYAVHKLSKGGVLRPLNFKSKILEAI